MGKSSCARSFLRFLCQSRILASSDVVRIFITITAHYCLLQALEVFHLFRKMIAVVRDIHKYQLWSSVGISTKMDRWRLWHMGEKWGYVKSYKFPLLRDIKTYEAEAHVSHSLQKRRRRGFCGKLISRRRHFSAILHTQEVKKLNVSKIDGCHRHHHLCVWRSQSTQSEKAFYNPLLSLSTTVIIQCRRQENVMWKWKKKSLQDDDEEYVAHKHALLCHRKIYSVSNNMKFSDETPFTTE